METSQPLWETCSISLSSYWVFFSLLSSLNVSCFSICCLSSSQHAPLSLTWPPVGVARMLLALPEAFFFPCWTSPVSSASTHRPSVPAPRPSWWLSTELAPADSSLSYIVGPNSGHSFLHAVQQVLTRGLITCLDLLAVLLLIQSRMPLWPS